MSLKLENISKAFDDKEILNSFSYMFSDTGLYIVTGDSGRGKTTLLRIISGLDRNFSGNVIGGGKENVSFAFQEYRLFPGLTAIENILVASFEKADVNSKKKAYELLKALNYTDEDMHLLPKELSGGMKQRISVARAILKEAPILILDEPTKELDDALEEVVADLIAQEAKKRLVILVTHQPECFENIVSTKIAL